MMRYLPQPVRGVLSLLLFVSNLVFWIVPFYVLGLLKLLPSQSLKARCFRGLEELAARWIGGNLLIAGLHDLEFDIRGAQGLALDDWYLVSANHQSWIDVFALQSALNRKIPFLRFFIKKELIWVPLLGLAWWAMELPFMHRHSKAQIAANPSLRKQDIEETRKACAACRDRPTTIMIFLEGTRFTPAKHAATKSPFNALLKPKVGGLAFAVSAIGDVLRKYLDVTIAYSKPGATFWDLMCGRVKRVVIDVREQRIPDDLFVGDYHDDAQLRERYRVWVDDLWRRKDELLAELQADASA